MNYGHLNSWSILLAEIQQHLAWFTTLEGIYLPPSLVLAGNQQSTVSNHHQPGTERILLQADIQQETHQYLVCLGNFGKGTPLICAKEKNKNVSIICDFVGMYQPVNVNKKSTQDRTHRLTDTFPNQVFLFWVVVSNILYFHPYLGKWSNLTSTYFSNGLVQPPPSVV